MGTLIRTDRGNYERIESLFEGAELLSPREEDPVCVNRPLLRRLEPCVRIQTDQGHELVCTPSHALLSGYEGTFEASESLDQWVSTIEGTAKIVEVVDVGTQVIIRLGLEPPNRYESNGIFSQE